MTSTDHQSDRIEYLDAVRGIAALSVVFYHILGSHWDWMRETKIAMFFLNGSDAVAMFFVLSGLVLSIKAINKSTEIDSSYYKRYSIARIFRLYPAFLFMLIIYYLYAHNNENIFTLFKTTITTNPHFFWEEALLVRDHHHLFFPDWTLGVEVALSLLVPFLVIVVRQSNKLLIFMIIGLMFAGKIYYSQFLLHFALGVLIANNFKRIVEFRDTSKWWYKYRWWLLPIVFFFYSMRHVLALYPLPGNIQYFMSSILYIDEYAFSGLASACLLLYIINTKRIQDILSHNVFSFLGKISYGVYLSHWLFTNIVMRNFEYLLNTYCGGNEGIFLFYYTIFTLVCTILAATFLYYLIELPAIRLGKKFVRRFAST